MIVQLGEPCWVVANRGDDYEVHVADRAAAIAECGETPDR